MAIPPSTPSKRTLSSPSKPTKSSAEETTDSEEKRSCHQCRQKTFASRATCKNQRNNKPCPISFCQKCLLNRYGEKAEEMNLLSDWKCPRCRGICNCSLCMKKKGHRPTGMLVYAAKATGFSSVSELLIAKGSKDLNSAKAPNEEEASPENTKVPIAGSPSKTGKENSFAGKLDPNLKKKISTKNVSTKNSQKCKRKTVGMNVTDEGSFGKTKGDEVKLKKSAAKKSRISEKVLNGVLHEGVNKRDGAELDVESHTKIEHIEEIGGPCGKTKGDEVKLKKNVAKKSRISEKIPNGVSNKRANKRDGAALDVESHTRTEHIEEVVHNAIKEEQKKCDSNGIPTSQKGRKRKTDGTVIKKEVNNSEKDDASHVEKIDIQVKVVDEMPTECVEKEDKIVEKNSSVLSGKELGGFGNEYTDKTKSKPKPYPMFSKLRKTATGTYNTDFEANISLPQCIDLTNVDGIDFPAEDVGHVLQFLEFCRAFGQVFDLKKGQPESVLRELMRGSSRRRGQYSSIVRFHIQLLSFLQKDSGEESLLSSSTSSTDTWLQALGECVSNSKCAFEDLPSKCFDKGCDGYYKLDSLQKLRLLNFLCDETLGTLEMRNWIDEQNSKVVEKEKAAKEKVLAAKEKEKRAKQQMQDKIAKATLLKDGAPLSIAEHDKLVSKMKSEVANAHQEMLQAMELVPQKKQRSDAVRTESILVDGNGHIFWRLNSYSNAANILVQDIGSLDSGVIKEKWFTYDVEQKNVVENYISLRRKRVRTPRVPDTRAFETIEASIKHETLVGPSSLSPLNGVSHLDSNIKQRCFYRRSSSQK